jgi:hypothetical protein
VEPSTFIRLFEYRHNSKHLSMLDAKDDRYFIRILRPRTMNQTQQNGCTEFAYPRGGVGAGASRPASTQGTSLAIYTTAVRRSDRASITQTLKYCNDPEVLGKKHSARPPVSDVDGPNGLIKPHRWID